MSAMTLCRSLTYVVNPLYTDIRYDDKTRYNDSLNETELAEDELLEILKIIVFNTPRSIWCRYLLESPRRGDSNKYPQHMFLGINKG